MGKLGRYLIVLACLITAVCGCWQIASTAPSVHFRSVNCHSPVQTTSDSELPISRDEGSDTNSVEIDEIANYGIIARGVPDDTPPKPPETPMPPMPDQWRGSEKLPPPRPGEPNQRAGNGNLNVRSTPTAEGAILRLAPDETATDRAVMLTRLLNESIAEAAALREKMNYLRDQLEDLKKARARDQQVAEQTASEAIKVRTQKEALHVEVASLRERLRRIERQDLDMLIEIVSVLERALQELPAKKPAH